MKLSSLLSFLPLVASVCAIDLDIGSTDSIKAAAKIAATKLRKLYPNTETWFVPGEFGLIQTPDGKNNKGYYWWEAGAAMGAWIDYWTLTGDETFNDIVYEAMLFQVGEKQDYEPANQTLSLGNDDQGFWGIAAMTAAERGFKDPPKDQPQWLALAQAVFNRQASRWDSATCDGGLRWQVFSSNEGYDYKNSISNGLLFQLGARLGRYTGNTTYIDWAEKVYAWTRDRKLISDDYLIHDGAHITPTCDVSSPILWSYNAGVYLGGAAFLNNYYNSTGNSAKTGQWKTETLNLMNAIDEPFFTSRGLSPGVMRESACEVYTPFTDTPTCNTDQRSFKAYLSRFMGLTYQLCPWTQEWIITRLKKSAVSAAKSCNGGEDGQTCGLSWMKEAYDGSPYGIAMGGVGEHMSALELFQALLVPTANAPIHNKDTGTSIGNNNAGTSGSGLSEEDLRQTDPSTPGDRAGAGILTTICLGGLMGLTYWLLRE